MLLMWMKGKKAPLKLRHRRLEHEVIRMGYHYDDEHIHCSGEFLSVEPAF
jgi:hypothetical protein